MTTAVSAKEATNALRKLKQRSQSKVASAGKSTAQSCAMRDTNKRPRAASSGDKETQHKKKTEAAPVSGPGQIAYGQDQWRREEEKAHFPTEGSQIEVEDEGGGPDITAEIAAIGHRNEQLQDSVASLKRGFSLREEETHQLLLGLGALNAVANELAALQKEYQERSSKNAALIQESLVQISNCSAQVDTLRRCRGLTATQLQNFRHECIQEMNKLVVRLGDLAGSTDQEPEPFDLSMNEKRQQIDELKEDVCGYRAQVSHDGSVTSMPPSSGTVGPIQMETTGRINLALTQLDELHAEMFQLKQALMQENQSFRRYLENLVSRQMAHIREVQDNETERIHEEMDDIRSGMCGILKDMHRLKERTKYLVPSMARVGPRMSRSNPNGPVPLESRELGDQKDERWMNIPSGIPHNTGYSMTMATRQCQDGLPHYEHGFDDDCYCPGVISSQTNARYTHPGQPCSSGSSNSSAGRSDDENWRMFPAEDAPATDQRPAQRCESPHYSSCASSLYGRLSVYGEEHGEANDAEQFEQRLLEQHRLFWIGEVAILVDIVFNFFTRHIFTYPHHRLQYSNLVRVAMATVRTPPPRGSEPANKRKRKRLHKSKSMATSSATSLAEAQLETLEKWHRALTVDMSELRREGARVRIELAKLDDTAEAAVEKSERCAAQAQAAVAASKAKDEAAQSTQAKLQAANAELDRLYKRFLTMEKKLERYQQSSINEEFLMTQLTELQEQYENELTKVREDHDAVLVAQQKQLERVMVHLQEEKKQKKQMENMVRMMQSLSEENSKLSHKISQVATRQEMLTIQQQMETMERDNQDEQGRTRVDLNTFEDKLVDMERRVTNAENNVLDIDRKVDDVGSRAPVAAPSHSMPLLPPPPPPLPRDLVRQGDLIGIHDQLRRISRDFQAVEVDITSLTKRTEAHGSQQKQHYESRLQELSTQLFDALSHDSRLHATEISRLKDAVFDVQGDHREFGQRMRRLEDDVQQAARAQPRDRGAPNWRYGQNPAPLRPTSPLPPPPPPPVFRNRRERPSRYEPAPDNAAAPAFEPPPQDRIRWAPRRRSRSRSRSPPRRPPWGATGNDSTPANGRRNQRFNPQVPANAAQNIHSRNEAAENSREEHPGLPFRRIRQPRRTPEVIVIEEDDDEEEDEEVEEGQEVARAPPDVVLDEEDASQTADVIVVDPPAKHVETTDLLEKEADVQTGLLLYFCLGGAPDLDVQWTSCFTQLNADECVEMPRALRFQRRYGFLQSFPVYLTQCILQAVILNGQNVAEGSDTDASRPTGAFNAAHMRAKFNDVVKEIHLSWAKALIELLSKKAATFDDLASEKLELSVNPAGLSSSADKDDVIYAWSRRQESVMWILARKLHYGSFLPAMKCNVDASPAVYLFTLMFDVLTVTSECPQCGTFRLNAFGGKALAYLWNHTLKKLPYVFFVDWSWLEDQSTKEKLPALAFCHLLASILLWNSAIDHHSLTNRNIYAAAVKHILPKLYVGGQAIHESVDSSSLLLAECESTHIELLDLDSKFASTLGLDGFFEVTEAIQNNMLAVAAAAKDPAST
ncbi:hypothetical protein PC123_g11209 [Phytophthora cactorum]|nr:hypothetical protein PC123_g11209 [Phytophthora cactorum]